MKIGDKVAVATNHSLLKVLNNRTGVIVDEHIPNSHAAMLSGKSKWMIRLDCPITLHGEKLTECEFREDELVLI